MSKNESDHKCANCFKSLGVSARIDIFTFLRSRGEATVGELVELVSLTQPTVSYHLKEMKGLGLLKSRKRGKEVYYSVNTKCAEYDSECVLAEVKFPGEENA
jgi:DNA-binding transcriptional ArsR family regulator